MKNKIKPILKTLLFYIFGCLLISFITESFGQGSIEKGFDFFKETPYRAFYNTALISLFLSPALLFKRRKFAFSLLSLPWLLFSGASYCLVQFRGSPLTRSDFSMISSAITLANQYISLNLIIIVLLLLVITILFLIFIWKFEHNKKRYNLKITIPLVLILFIAFPSYITPLKQRAALLRQLSDLYSSYQYNGFTHSFLYTILNSGMSKPDEYSEESVADVMNNFYTLTYKEADLIEQPNIVFIQLESFFDPTWITNLTFNEDPIPVFRSLYEGNSNGLLHVPVIGGGTVNTEFEVLTGFPISSFASGEIPYNTILKTKPLPSINYILKDYDYSTHAIHNHDGTFYDRYLVYPNLGFDTFTSSEYMYGYDKTPQGWMKDKYLTDEIKKAITSTEESDLIYAVSVQGHGSYPSDITLENQKIFITDNDGITNDLKNSWVTKLLQEI